MTIDDRFGPPFAVSCGADVVQRRLGCQWSAWTCASPTSSSRLVTRPLRADDNGIDAGDCDGVRDMPMVGGGERSVRSRCSVLAQVMQRIGDLDSGLGGPPELVLWGRVGPLV